MFARITLRIALASPIIFIAASQAAAATIQLGAAKDTMIFQNNVNNGAGGGPGIFAGTNSAMSRRRGIIAFDLSSIPSDATITAVQLRLKIGQITAGFSHPTIGLYKLLVNWGEVNTGASTATNLNGLGQGHSAQSGDATWNARFYDATTPTLWSSPGGAAGTEYTAAASASLVQSDNLNDISLWLSTPELVADAQGWLNSPSTNFGWMLINTNETAAQTFRGFYSRNFNPNPTVPDLESYFPQLIVTYVPEPSAIMLALCGALAVVLWGRRFRSAS